MKRTLFFLFLIFALGSTTALAQNVIFTSMNIAGVQNSPTAPAVFTINQPHLITYILNYHWNNARGKAGGTIGLRAANGQVFGPWSTTTSPGQGGVPNANWLTQPNVVIPAGTYTIVDSDPSTWAQNSQSGGRGMAEVRGIAQAAPQPVGQVLTPPNDPVIYNNGNIAGVMNNPTQPTVFTTDRPQLITWIMTYHWNNAQGKPGGAVGLRSASGQTLGPWPAATAIGQGGVPNAYWFVKPGVVIPAGTYTVVDSDPATWAQNSGSAGKGMCDVRGIAQGSPPPPPSVAINVSGQWDMTANVSFQFLLTLSQQADRITGTMTRTNGSEPVDSITGSVLSDGTVKFTRQRQGSWRQDYTGRLSQEGSGFAMNGTFTQDGSGNYSWNARKRGVSPPPPPPPSGQVLTPPNDPVIYNNGNIAGVMNNPTQPTVFTTDRPQLITWIMTYHWNNAQGKPGGTVGLRSASGQTFGPWPAATAIGQGGVPNAYWFVKPGVVIPAGTYTVVDSDPATWAQNSGSAGKGMCDVRGIAQGSPPPPPAPTGNVIFSSMNIAGVQNSPTAPAVFTINQPHLITYILNYHWNNARGKAGGTIGLRAANGQVFGPWSTTTSPGQGGVPNANWQAQPNVVIPAGTYTIVDSDPSTWAQNSQSGGCGMAEVRGIPQQGAPPPPPPPPTAGDFIWLGKDTDMVGSGGNGKPDGKWDGHFQLNLSFTASTEVRSIAVYSSNAAGNPEGGQIWHTQNGSYWVLGVFQGGRQLNPSHVPTLGQYNGRVQFDLYCNDSGFFKEGQYFMAEVVLGNGQKINKVVRQTGPSVALETFSWVDRDADKVGQGGNGKPDGQLDGHFQLVLNLGGKTEVQSIAVHSSNAAGNPEGGQIWHSQNGSYWVLGVFKQGSQVNPTHVPTLGFQSGRIPLDLYCSDSGYFKDGQNFMVEVLFADGRKLNRTVKITVAAASIESFAWVDRDADKVGQGGNGKPDGKIDGHFQLALSLGGRTEIKSIAVYSSNAAGNPEGGQIWHSQNGSYWVLGVFQQGNQINPSHAPTLGFYSGRLPLDLYGSDSGYFKDGQNFMVEVIFADGRKLNKVARINSPAANIESFTWIGKNEDRVGPGGNGRPNGQPDGRFQLTMGLAGRVEITLIAVYSSNAAGSPEGGQIWHSQNGSYWMLGVFQGGRQLNPSHVPTLGFFSGPLPLDLFANDSGWFKGGQNFLVEVMLYDGRKLQKVVRLP